MHPTCHIEQESKDKACMYVCTHTCMSLLSRSVEMHTGLWGICDRHTTYIFGLMFTGVGACKHADKTLSLQSPYFRPFFSHVTHTLYEICR